jgi:hypothetical protein
MTNGNAQNTTTMAVLYKAAVLVLLAIAGFIGANIYGKVDQFPIQYVTLERYKCDLDKIEKGLDGINHKLDRFISKNSKDE